MSDGVFTRIKRVTFAEGQETTSPDSGYVACGPGTRRPLKITRDQLAELAGRVKDAKFSGSISSEYSFATFALAFTSAAMPADNYSGTDADCVIQRAYADATTKANITRERDIFITSLATPEEIYGGLAGWTGGATHGLVCGMTHYAESVEIASGYYPYGFVAAAPSAQYRAAVEIAFTGEVGWVDLNGSGNPFDPLNELWIGLNFFCFSWDYQVLDGSTTGLSLIFVDAYTELQGNPNEGQIGDLTIVLSTGAITCPLYASNHAFLVGYSSSLTLTATEWWPYASTTGAVWDSGTGEKI